MSGGSHEYVMGVMQYSNGEICVGVKEIFSSGFQGKYCEEDYYSENGIKLPANIKYYDVYLYSLNTLNYNRRILGDAIGEMGPFQMDTEKRMISSWYNRESQNAFCLFSLVSTRRFNIIGYKFWYFIFLW